MEGEKPFVLRFEPPPPNLAKKNTYKTRPREQIIFLIDASQSMHAEQKRGDDYQTPFANCVNCADEFTVRRIQSAAEDDVAVAFFGCDPSKSARRLYSVRAEKGMFQDDKILQLQTLNAANALRPSDFVRRLREFGTAHPQEGRDDLDRYRDWIDKILSPIATERIDANYFNQVLSFIQDEFSRSATGNIRQTVYIMTDKPISRVIGFRPAGPAGPTGQPGQAAALPSDAAGAGPSGAGAAGPSGGSLDYGELEYEDGFEPGSGGRALYWTDEFGEEGGTGATQLPAGVAGGAGGAGGAGWYHLPTTREAAAAQREAVDKIMKRVATLASDRRFVLCPLGRDLLKLLEKENTFWRKFLAEARKFRLARLRELRGLMAAAKKKALEEGDEAHSDDEGGAEGEEEEEGDGGEGERRAEEMIEDEIEDDLDWEALQDGEGWAHMEGVLDLNSVLVRANRGRPAVRAALEIVPPAAPSEGGGGANSNSKAFGLGAGLSVAVRGYIPVKPYSPDGLVKIHPDPERPERVVVKRQYLDPSQPGSDPIKRERFTREYLPYGYGRGVHAPLVRLGGAVSYDKITDRQAALRALPLKTIRILGFKPRAALSDMCPAGQAYFLEADEGERQGSTRPFNDLLTAMLQEDRMAIVAWQRGAARGPLLCALLPRESSVVMKSSKDPNPDRDPPGLYLVELVDGGSVRPWASQWFDILIEKAKDAQEKKNPKPMEREHAGNVLSWVRQDRAYRAEGAAAEAAAAAAAAGAAEEEEEEEVEEVAVLNRKRARDEDLGAMGAGALEVEGAGEGEAREEGPPPPRLSKHSGRPFGYFKASQDEIAAAYRVASRFRLEPQFYGGLANPSVQRRLQLIEDAALGEPASVKDAEDMEYLDRTVPDPHCLDPAASGGPRRKRALEAFREAVYGGVVENEGKTEDKLIDDLRAKNEKRAKDQAKKESGLDEGELVDLYRAGRLSGALVADLKAYLKKHGLRVTGLKPELVEKVKEHMVKNLRFNN